jgi:pyridoxamine 5'-phosphate oxidase
MQAQIDPIEVFTHLFEKAKRKDGVDATVSTLATADTDARPSARAVLLKHVDHQGFVFYTNLKSRKARELEANPQAALSIYWPWLDTQVRIEGRVEPISDAESDAYFEFRPRGSQLSAWTSKQSQPLASRQELLARYLKIKTRFLNKEIPRPDFWGGYRIVPDRMEIWHNQLHRLHDRFLYLREGDDWSMQRLYP